MPFRPHLPAVGLPHAYGLTAANRVIVLTFKEAGPTITTSGYAGVGQLAIWQRSMDRILKIAVI